MDFYIDLETYGTVPLRSHGSHRYAENAEIMLACIAWDNGAPEVWDFTDDDDDTYKLRLRALQGQIDRAATIVTHGSFDRILCASNGVTVPLEKQDDTMLTALQHGLPGGLDKLCGILGVPLDDAKETHNKKLINLFCSPTPKNWKIRRATKHTHPAEWAAFVSYNLHDVTAMRAVRYRLPRWNCTPVERTLWYLDQRTNERGMAVDQHHANAAIKAFDDVKRRASDDTSRLTNGLLTSTSQREKLLRILEEEHGYVGDLTKATLEAKLRVGNLDPELRELLEVRIKASAASPAKYKALLRGVGRDGRLRDTLQFCGAARTGRDAGRIFQPQNLPRPTLSKEDVETGITAMQKGCADLLFDVSELCISAVRGSIIAEPGNKLIVADLSNIEGRILAWLAGEEWKLEAFRAFDRGEGHDLYKITAARVLGKQPGDITKDERQKMGKVPELACGYQGSVGAFRRMGGPAVERMSDDEILAIVRQWRRLHPKTQSFWFAMENAVRATLHNPDKIYQCGLISFDTAKGPEGSLYLRMRLPSGRYLCYLNPESGTRDCATCEGQGVIRVPPDMTYAPCGDCEGVGGWGTGNISYKGINQTTTQWGEQTTYGGKLVENCVQAIARDVFMYGMRRAFVAGYEIVLRVHDELVAEVPTAFGSAQGLMDCMTINPVWTSGLPLAATGFETQRYFKD